MAKAKPGGDAFKTYLDDKTGNRYYCKTIAGPVVYQETATEFTAGRILARRQGQPLTREQQLEMPIPYIRKLDFVGKPLDINHSDALGGDVFHQEIKEEGGKGTGERLKVTLIAHMRVRADTLNGRNAKRLLEAGVKSLSATTTEVYDKDNVYAIQADRVAICPLGARRGTRLLKDNADDYKPDGVLNSHKLSGEPAGTNAASASASAGAGAFPKGARTITLRRTYASAFASQTCASSTSDSNSVSLAAGAVPPPPPPALLPGIVDGDDSKLATSPAAATSVVWHRTGDDDLIDSALAAVVIEDSEPSPLQASASDMASATKSIIAGGLAAAANGQKADSSLPVPSLTAAGQGSDKPASAQNPPGNGAPGGQAGASGQLPAPAASLGNAGGSGAPSTVGGSSAPGDTSAANPPQPVVPVIPEQEQGAYLRQLLEQKAKELEIRQRQLDQRQAELNHFAQMSGHSNNNNNGALPPQQQQQQQQPQNVPNGHMPELNPSSMGMGRTSNPPVNPWYNYPGQSQVPVPPHQQQQYPHGGAVSGQRGRHAAPPYPSPQQQQQSPYQMAFPSSHKSQPQQLPYHQPALPPLTSLYPDLYNQQSFPGNFDQSQPGDFDAWEEADDGAPGQMPAAPYHGQQHPQQQYPTPMMAHPQQQQRALPPPVNPMNPYARAMPQHTQPPLSTNTANPQSRRPVWTGNQRKRRDMAVHASRDYKDDSDYKGFADMKDPRTMSKAELVQSYLETQAALDGTLSTAVQAAEAQQKGEEELSGFLRHAKTILDPSTYDELIKNKPALGVVQASMASGAKPSIALIRTILNSHPKLATTAASSAASSMSDDKKEQDHKSDVDLNRGEKRATTQASRESDAQANFDYDSFLLSPSSKVTFGGATWCDEDYYGIFEMNEVTASIIGKPYHVVHRDWAESRAAAEKAMNDTIRPYVLKGMEEGVKHR